MHDREVHAHETHAYEVYPYEIHTHEMHAYETPAHEMHTREMYTREIYAHRSVGFSKCTCICGIYARQRRRHRLASPNTMSAPDPHYGQNAAIFT